MNNLWLLNMGNNANLPTWLKIALLTGAIGLNIAIVRWIARNW
jgi:hypothetical protein